MIVVVIIGLLASVAVPTWQKVREATWAAALSNDYRVFSDAFNQYSLEEGMWPPDGSTGNVPVGMQGHLPATAWEATSPVGGNWEWEYNSVGVTAGVASAQPDYAWYFRNEDEDYWYAWGTETHPWWEIMEPGRPSGSCTIADMFHDTLYCAFTEPLTVDLSGYHFYAGIVFANEYDPVRNEVVVELQRGSMLGTPLASASVTIDTDVPTMFSLDFGTIYDLDLFYEEIILVIDYVGGGILPQSHIYWDGEDCPSALYAEEHGANGGINEYCKVAVHVLPYANRSCEVIPSIYDCGDIITTEMSAYVDVFPVFFDLLEYNAVEFGLTWPGLYSSIYTGCSDLTLGNPTYAGDGVHQVWFDCQIRSVCVPGWSWIYDYGVVCVTDHPEYGGIYISDCEGGKNSPTCNFCACIGGACIGDDPCEPTAAEPQEWGSIKAMFK